MTPPTKSGLVKKLAESTQKHAEELVEQNERLKSLVASLQEKQTKITGELTNLRGERDILQGERARLKTVLDQALEQNRRDIERSALVEEQCTSLANLYVATYKLHGSLERSEVLAAISEIVHKPEPLNILHPKLALVILAFAISQKTGKGKFGWAQEEMV